MLEESKAWYKLKRPLFNSGFESDEFGAFATDGFEEVLESFLAQDVLVHDKCIYKTPKKTRAIIQSVTPDVQTGSIQRQILCRKGTLRCGQYIQVEDAYWIVSGLPDNNGIYEKAVLWKSKDIIHFISPLSGEVVHYPVYSINSTQYGTGEATEELLRIGASRHLVYIPYNEETIMLNNGFRFIMDRNTVEPTVYRLAQVDPVSYAVGDELGDGLIQWSVAETQLNTETDNIELMIADYFRDAPEIDTVPDSSGGALILRDQDGDYSLTIGEDKTLYVSCVDSGGNNVDSFYYSANLSVTSDVASIVSAGDGTIVLHAEDDRKNIGVVAHLTVTSDYGSADAEIWITGW